jgi:hypothetical protein
VGLVGTGAATYASRQADPLAPQPELLLYA